MRIKLILTAAGLMMLTGCFTGVESTPKITQRDVKRQNVVDTPERHVLDSVAATPPAAWPVGKRFYIADDRVARAAWRAEPRRGLAGHTAVFAGSQNVPTLTGAEEVQLNFTVDGIAGSLLEIRTGVTPKAWQTQKAYTIPHIVDMDMVNAVAAHLVGNTYYILPARRLTSAGNDTIGRRYDPVKITAVVPATEATPVKVIFTDPRGHTSAVLMTLGDVTTSRRNFETLFAIENPRQRHKDITDHVWDLICQSSVELGMTSDECRLALGSPDNYMRVPTTAGMAERWSYSNGSYLYFEDGVLAAYRR